MCEVEADPKDVKFKWTFNNSHESHVIANVTSNGTKSVALYEPKSRFDYGSVICSAENSAGAQRDPCIFNIIAAGKFFYLLIRKIITSCLYISGSQAIHFHF